MPRRWGIPLSRSRRDRRNCGVRLKSLAQRAVWKSACFFRIAVLYARYLATVRARALNQIADCILPLISPDRLMSVKRTDTVFVLGSGSSINAISDAKWQTIATYDSIAFNFWLY